MRGIYLFLTSDVRKQKKMIQKEDIIKFLQKESSDTRALRDASNKDIGSKLILIINQRREFFWRAATLALGLSGGLTFFYNKTVHKEFFYLSLFFFGLVVIYAIVWTREVLDSDGNDLQKLQDKYNTAFKEKIDLINEQAKEIYQTNPQEFITNYFNKLKQMSSVPSLMEEFEQVDKARRNRDKQVQDYSGEIFVFLFFCGLLFLIFSLIWIQISILLMLSSVLLIFGISFSDNLLKIVRSISKIADKLNKVKLFSKEKNN